MLNEFNYEVEHIRGKDNVVADTLSRFPPDVDAAVTRNVNLPIVGATLTSEKQFITALFMSSGLDELKAHFQNLRQLQLDDPFLGPIFRTRIQGNKPEAHFRHFRIHQDILIFFHPSDRPPRSTNGKCNPQLPTIWSFRHFKSLFA
jgi:hypothetical protein